MKITASGINTVELKIFERTFQMKFNTHGMINVLLSRQFHILITSFFANAMPLPRLMVVAYATEFSLYVMTACSTPLHHFSLRAPGSVYPISFNNVHSDPSKVTKNTTNGEAQQAKETTINS